MIASVFDELKKDARKPFHRRHHRRRKPHQPAVGCRIPRRRGPGRDALHVLRPRLGRTVSANKNTIKIMGEETELYGQGYSSNDSKKAGAMHFALALLAKAIHSAT